MKILNRIDMKSTLQKSLGAMLVCVGLGAGASAQAQTTNIVSGALPAGTNNWYRTNEYHLYGAVFVRSNSVLNIEAGTIIKGHNLGTFGTNVSALYVARGAKIYAEGTPKHPIIMTAEADDVTLPDDVGIYQRGLWGGLVVFGNTTINGALDTAGNAATPKYEVYEGLPDIDLGGGEFPFRFGGNDDNDNSGIIRYVSIRHGGAKLSTDKEINGLSMGAVGRGTTIEFVEAYAIADDGFEFFGGTVNTKYLVSAFCDDDAFDVDMGYRGTNQFWFGIQAPDARNYGMEVNNQINEIVTTNLLTPQADFKVYNATVIGSGTANLNVTGGRNAAIILRPYVAMKVYNSIFTDFNERAIELDVRQGVGAAVSVTNNYTQFHNTLWYGFVTGSGSGIVNNSITNLSRNTETSNYWSDASLTNLIANPLLASISRTNIGTTLDPRPLANSPAYTNYGATPNDGFLTPVAYQGAFGPNDLWISGWTALSEYGIVTPAHVTTNIVSGALPAGTNTWYRTNEYHLYGAVFVRSNSTLNIEAGTVIKGHNLGTFGTNVSALYVARGAKIYAQGTPQNPIIMTAEADDVTLPDDVGIYQRGLWGGLVVFGSTTINGALDTAGNAATPKYEVYEGLPDIDLGGGEFPFRFGGNDDNDNSGIIRYVSIRHGGAKLSTDKEINGLSLGAVGRGTTVEYVEAYAIADDGFEFFGGTVNTKYLVSAFCDDDSFDTDMGYRGTNQFWFGIQAPDARNYGMEVNNQINEIVTTNLLTPQADFKVYNCTIIGAGTSSTNVTGGRNAAIILRPYVAMKVYNSIFTDFNERGIELDVRQGVGAAVSVTNNYTQFHNTLWFGFVTGSGSTIVDNSISNLSRNTVASNYWTDVSLTNLIANPLLTGISRTNDISDRLDPRPLSGSPANSNAAATPGNLTAASYQGAFASGRGNWAADWTALNEYSILTAAGGINPATIQATATAPAPNPVTLTITPNGGNVDINFTSQAGYTYTLESTAVLSPANWGTATGATPSNPQVGSGGTLTFTVPVADAKYFQVKAN